MQHRCACSNTIGADTIRTMQREVDVAGYFDNVVAHAYAASHESLPTIHVDSMQQLKMFAPGNRLLEVGTGHGRDYPFLTSLGFDYTGIELSNAMIWEAKLRHPTIQLQQGDLYALNFPENSFDAFWAAAVYHHVPPHQLVETLREARRVLTPSGVAFFSVRSGGNAIKEHPTISGITYYHYTADIFIRSLQEAGFSILQSIQRKNPPGATPPDITYLEVIAQVRK